MNYYNENDPRAVDWLGQLIKEGLIPDGHIDSRSITDIRADELSGFDQCHFFAGIAGWPLALQLSGWPVQRKVWTGSCPCQPFSCAGKKRGESDPRHLWPVWRELISQSKPDVIFGEQVASAAGRVWLSGVQTDVERMGFAFGAADLCSASVGAPNIRQRLYWVAQSECAQRWANGARDEHYGSDAGRNETAGRAGSCGESGGRVAIPESIKYDRCGNSGRGRGESANNSGLGDTTEQRHKRKISEFLSGGQTEGRLPAGPGNPGRVDNARCERDEQRGRAENVVCAPGDQQGKARERQRSGNADSDPKPTGFWGTSRWWKCADGKERRIPVEPAFFPLSARIPGRVAMLRGFGNAINPQIAKEFISAYLETNER